MFSLMKVKPFCRETTCWQKTKYKMLRDICFAFHQPHCLQLFTLKWNQGFEKLLTLSEWGKKRSTHRERCRQVHWLVELLSLSEISMGARKAQIRGIKFYPALHFQTCASSGLGCIACDGGSRLWYIIPKGEGIQRVYHCCWKMHTSTDWKT